MKPTILEADTIKQVEMKDNIQNEYLRRTRKLLETKLSRQKPHQRNKYLCCAPRWIFEQMVCAQPSICPWKWHTWTLMWLWHTLGSPNLGQKTRPNNNQQKKRICKIVDFAIPADYRIKLKECKKKDKYLDLARELKKLWNMKVMIVPIVIGACGTESKGLLNGFKSWRTCGDHPNYIIIDNGQNTVKSPGDLRRLAITQTPVKDHQLKLM